MLAAVLFAVGAAVSLATSWLLVSRLERVGERLGLSEAVLGLVAALAADAPEITAAIAALASHQQQVGAGVVLGSNVFNLAALLGLGAVVAGRIGLHRRVVALSGSIALWVAFVCALVVTGALTPLAGLVLAAAAVGLYVFILGTGGRGLRLPASWRAWLHSAVAEEELELEDAIRPRRGRWTRRSSRGGRTGHSRHREHHDGAGSRQPRLDARHAGDHHRRPGPRRSDQSAERRSCRLPGPPRPRRSNAQHSPEQQHPERPRGSAAARRPARPARAIRAGPARCHLGTGC